MSEALQISTFHDSFHNRLATRQITDLKKTTSDCFKSKEVYYKKLREITSESTLMGAEHFFSIPNAYSYVSDFSLEVISDNSNAWDFPALGWGVHSLLRRIEIEIGSRKLCDYTGSDLVKIIHLVNKDNSVREELALLAGAGDTDDTPMITPIVAPGSNCIYSTDASDMRSPAFPIGACANPLIIRVTMQSTTYGTTQVFVMASLKLKFWSYSVKNDAVPNIRASGGKNIYYTWNFIRPMSHPYTRTLTNATEDSFTIDSVITQGMLNGVVISILDRTTHKAAKDHQDFQPIDELTLTVRGSEELYEHSNAIEARMFCLKDWKVTSKLAGTTAALGYIYPMSLTGRPEWFTNVGTQGMNLNLNKPTISLTCTTLTNSASAHSVDILAIYKGLWNVYTDKSAKLEINP